MRTGRYGVLGTMLLWTMGCGGKASDPPPTPAAATVRITVKGATSMVPLSSEAANIFMKAHPGVIVEVSPGSSHDGINGAADGTATIGLSDLFATGSQAATLEDHRVAVVGVGVFANKGPFNSRVASLSKEQLRGIFTGRIKSWKEVGGGNQAMVPLHRNQDSGTRYVFGSVVMEGQAFAAGEEIGSSGKMQSALRTTPGAISYLVLSYAHPDLQAMNVDGVPASTETITAGAYPLWAYEHMYVKPPVDATTSAFLGLMLNPSVQNALLARLGFIPIAAMKVSRDKD
jgi:phosphate transport system substrate-binding protein